MLERIAYDDGLALTGTNGRDEQRRLGQYMTPPPIAQFMARRTAVGLGRESIRVLEPAAGSGVLIAAMVRALCASTNRPRRIEVLAYEIDPRLHPALRATCARCADEARARGVEVVFELRCEDFLLAPLCLARQPVVDVVIANPPYFKLNGRDPKALAHSAAVHGQPNVYGLFMAACAALLRQGGRWCFITPRSWTSGPYFKAVRRQLLDRTRLDAIHIFESRTDHFEDDAVLQEAIVAWGTVATARSSIEFSSSAGLGDIESCAVQAVPSRSVIRGDELLIALPAGNGRRFGESWPETLGSLGLKVSTGPTVAFRQRRHLRGEASAGRVPLLWLQHVRRMHVQWPLGRRDEHIDANAQTAWMLLHNEPLVIMRRFSPKEDVRRMTAAAYLGDLPASFIGLENHLNYIHRPGGSMTAREVRGLAAVLNSAPADDYFRSMSGNTQVNAAELRAMPLPGWDCVLDVADRIANRANDLESIDAALDGASSAIDADIRVAA